MERGIYTLIPAGLLLFFATLFLLFRELKPVMSISDGSFADLVGNSSILMGSMVDV